MAILPQFVLFKEVGIDYALSVARQAYASGFGVFVIEKPREDINFCKDVEVILKNNFPIKSITGTSSKLTVEFINKGVNVNGRGS